MNGDMAYSSDLECFADHLHDLCPEDLAERFREASGLKKEDFRQCSREFGDCLAAVDGSNSTLLESGSFAVAAVRAVASAYRNQERSRLATSPMRVLRIGPEEDSEAFKELYYECFGRKPETEVKCDEPDRAGAVLRDTLEYWVADRMVDDLSPGDCLLFDGALSVSHASHDPVLRDLLQKAGVKGILIAAVSKRTSSTWGGGYPLVRAVERFASSLGIQTPWFVEIPESLLDHQRYAQWQKGRLYVARLHQHADQAFKIEVPKSADEKAVFRTFTACAAYSGDGRLPGYPWPLLDAHRTVCITEDIREQIILDIIKNMSSKSMKFEDFRKIFGDIHDEFARY